MMRQLIRQRELLKLVKTLFVTAFITLSHLHEQKNNLRKMFTSLDSSKSKWAKEQKGKNVAKTVIMSSFWNTIIIYLKISSPLVRVLTWLMVKKKKKAPM